MRRWTPAAAGEEAWVAVMYFVVSRRSRRSRQRLTVVHHSILRVLRAKRQAMLQQTQWMYVDWVQLEMRLKIPMQQPQNSRWERRRLGSREPLL